MAERGEGSDRLYGTVRGEETYWRLCSFSILERKICEKKRVLQTNNALPAATILFRGLECNNREIFSILSVPFVYSGGSV